MKENILIVGLFFVFGYLLILSQAFLLTRVLGSQTIIQTPLPTEIVQKPKIDKQIAGSIFSPGETADAGCLDYTAISGDARPMMIKKYLQKFNSELEPYAELIFDVSQKNGLDYRLMTAIAQQESNLCKKQPENCFNCFGVGIHSRGTMCFKSYPEAIEWMGRYLKEEYYDLGLTTVEAIMGKYCPLSSGSWANGVNQFMKDIENN